MFFAVNGQLSFSLWRQVYASIYRHQLVGMRIHSCLNNLLNNVILNILEFNFHIL